MTQLSETVQALLDEGRRRKQREAAEKKATETAQDRADKQHWLALEGAIKTDLAAHGMGSYFVTLGDKPDNFHRAEDRYSGTREYVVRINIPGVGDIGRQYNFFAMKDEGKPDFWRPWNRHHGTDKNWASVVYGTFGPWDETDESVDAAESKEWFWFVDLEDALAEAEVQYAARNRLLLDVQQRNAHRKDQAEKRLVQKKEYMPTTGERLLEVLEDFVKECVPTRSEE